MQDAEKKHLEELSTKSAVAEEDYYKYNSRKDLFEDSLSMVSIVATAAMALIGMLVIFICSFIDAAVSGKIAIVFSYFSIIFALFIPMTFLAAWHFSNLAISSKNRVTRIEKQIEIFKKVVDMKLTLPNKP